MDESIKPFVTLILAIYAIIQVWIIALWKKYARKGKIDYYETGTVEIGYSTFGPTVGLHGTLRALNKDVFIRSIDLLVVREKDKAQHIFRWLAFRSPQIYLAGSQPSSMEIPSGFLISPNSPHRFNIAFNDSDLLEEIRPIFNDYISEWYKVVNQLTKIRSPQSGALKQEIVDQQVAIIEDFRRCNKVKTDTYTALDRKCYWEPGDYSLTINVETARPDKVFTKNYRFSINEADSKNLKLNVITILEDPISSDLKIQNYPYRFAYSAYK